MTLNNCADLRWLSPDPMGGNVMNPQSFNRYAYALNNPATFNDPLGLQASCSNHENCKAYGESYGRSYAEYEASCGINGCENMFGGGDNCEVNGVRSPCTLAYSMLQSGAALPPGVPNNAQVVNSSGGTVTIEVPGGCVTIGKTHLPCNAPPTYVMLQLPGSREDDSLPPFARATFSRVAQLAGPPVRDIALAAGAESLALATMFEAPEALAVGEAYAANNPGVITTGTEFAKGVFTYEPANTVPSVYGRIVKAVLWFLLH